MSSRKARRPELSIVREGVPTVSPVGLTLPQDEKAVVKEVPAKVDGIVVGIAQIYDDGSVGVILNEDAPKEQIDKIGGLAGQYGFSIGDIFDGPT